MLEPTNSASGAAVSKGAAKDRAEILVWKGTAYGRRRKAETPAQAHPAQADPAKADAEAVSAVTPASRVPGATSQPRVQAIAASIIKLSKLTKSTPLWVPAGMKPNLAAGLVVLAAASMMTSLAFTDAWGPTGSSSVPTSPVELGVPTVSARPDPVPTASTPSTALAAPAAQAWPEPAVRTAIDVTAGLPQDQVARRLGEEQVAHVESGAPATQATPEAVATAPAPAAAIPVAPVPQPEAVAAPAAPAQSADHEHIERAERAASDAAAKLAQEREARVFAEEKAASLAAQIATERQARETAESTRAAISAELDAARKARAEAEDAARLANAALSEKEKSFETVALQGASVAAPPVSAIAKPIAVPPQRVASTRAAGPTASSVVANSDLAEGRKLLARGDLKAARQHFERAASSGLPEAALAAGNTFDPVSLTKAGLKEAGDPARARLWYRRAYELAQSRQ